MNDWLERKLVVTGAEVHLKEESVRQQRRELKRNLQLRRR